MKFQTALLHWSWTLGTFNGLILRLDWPKKHYLMKFLNVNRPGKQFLFGSSCQDFWVKFEPDGDLAGNVPGTLVMS